MKQLMKQLKKTIIDECFGQLSTLYLAQIHPQYLQLVNMFDSQTNSPHPMAKLITIIQK